MQSRQALKCCIGCTAVLHSSTFTWTTVILPCALHLRHLCVWLRALYMLRTEHISAVDILVQVAPGWHGSAVWAVRSEHKDLPVHQCPPPRAVDALLEHAYCADGAHRLLPNTWQWRGRQHASASASAEGHGERLQVRPRPVWQLTAALVLQVLAVGTHSNMSYVCSLHGIYI